MLGSASAARSFYSLSIAARKNWPAPLIASDVATQLVAGNFRTYSLPNFFLSRRLVELLFILLRTAKLAWRAACVRERLLAKRISLSNSFLNETFQLRISSLLRSSTSEFKAQNADSLPAGRAFTFVRAPMPLPLPLAVLYLLVARFTSSVPLG